MFYENRNIIFVYDKKNVRIFFGARLCILIWITVNTITSIFQFNTKLGLKLIFYFNYYSRPWEFFFMFTQVESTINKMFESRHFFLFPSRKTFLYKSSYKNKKWYMSRFKVHHLKNVTTTSLIIVLRHLTTLLYNTENTHSPSRTKNSPYSKQ